jgi:protein-disulfide isomerase
MKFLVSFLAVLGLFAAAIAQRPDEMLATSIGTTYTVKSLSPQAQKLFETQDQIIAGARSRLLSEMITGVLLDLESKAQNKTAERLIEEQRAKVAEPLDTQINAVYDANRAALGDRTLEQSRKEIVAFLRREPEQKVVDEYIKTLTAKYKVTLGKDVNAAGLKPLDLLATIGTRSISAQEFDEKNKVAMADARAEIYDGLESDLEASILSALVAEEAKVKNTDTSSIIAAEITDKLRDYSDEERAALESALQKHLFTKYNVKILLKEPTPFVQNISADDDPMIGKATAPVTVVMFTDLQCPACSRTHPVLKRVIAEYGDKVRLVLRDFPLENIHENAFLAARAGYAAKAQGKFIEYAETLYRNQDALDKASLLKYAADLGLNVKQFELDLSGEKAAAEIRKDQADGRSYGIGGTPAIFVNGIKVHRLSAQAFRKAIDRALKK